MSASTDSKTTQQLAELLESGRYAELEDQARQILKRYPDDGLAWLYLGDCLQNQGKDAHIALENSVRLNPANPIAANNWGNSLRQQGQLDAALTSFKRALEIKPDFVEAHCNHGVVLANMGQLSAAMQSFRLALDINPGLAELHYNLGSTLKDLGQLREATESLGQALKIKPDYAEAHCNLGTVFRELGKLSEALSSYTQALQIKPGLVEAHSNLGATLKDLGRLEEAERSYRHALRLKPEFASAHSGLSETLRILGRYDEAQRSYLLARHFDPDCVETQMNQSFMYLQRGDFEVGWLTHECRWKQKGTPALNFDGSLWLGRESLESKTIIICAEQGFGDTIQFIRFATILASMGARVIAAGPDSLKRLLMTVSGITQVITPGEDLPHHDFYCPLLSLPLALRITQEAQIPADLPYLVPSIADVKLWALKTAHTTQRKRVGIVWAGNPTFKRDKQRSIPFETFSPLLEIAGIDFYSLQKGEAGVAELAASALSVYVNDLTADLHDFADTAALIANLDLVITIDSSVAHLAGAMGKRVWLLNRYDTCWRWMLERDDSPWYPGVMRIFRQAEPGQWHGVIEQVAQALRLELGAV